MLAEHKSLVAARIRAAVEPLAAQAGIAVPDIVLERPKQAAHGDLACNVALQLARPLGRNPREVARAVCDALAADDAARGLIAAAEIAGPGFINLRLADAARAEVVRRVLREGAAFGRSARGQGAAVVVEFVSANPTGPLHVGHARQGALGDAIVNLMDACGWRASREFYYNDAGAQIANLALSVQARARGIEPGDERFPADGYRGDYIVDIARDYLAGATVAGADTAPVTGRADPDDLDAIRRFAVAYLRHEQDVDLRAFGIVFDTYYLESSLYADGRVEAAVRTLIERGCTYEQDGALWFRSTDFGDDKDRVMRKSDGAYTYFVPDVAYHVTKWQRGFGWAVNVQGTDHHGTIARVRAGLQALAAGIPAGYPDYVLHKMVRVVMGGEELKMSKRAGTGVTLRDLLDMTASGDTPEERLQRARDAVRFFLVSRKADSEYTFDVDLARSRGDDNPVWYIQYAHARIRSVFERLRADGQAAAGEADVGEADVGAAGAPDATADAAAALADAALADAALADADLSPLGSPHERALLARLAEYPQLVTDACDDLAPHAVAFWLKELAAELHGFYNAERVLVDDAALRTARLALLAATAQVLRNGLALIGVSAPERM